MTPLTLLWSVNYCCFSFIEATELSTSANLIIGIYFCQDAPAADDDDDLDLFGDETEEDKKAAEEREAAKKPAKKKESKLSFCSLCNSLFMKHFPYTQYQDKLSLDLFDPLKLQCYLGVDIYGGFLW